MKVYIKNFLKIGIIFKFIVYNRSVQKIRDKKTDTKKIKKKYATF